MSEFVLWALLEAAPVRRDCAGRFGDGAVSMVDGPQPVHDPTFVPPPDPDVVPSDPQPNIPDQEPVIDPAPAPLNPPRPAPEPLPRPD